VFAALAVSHRIKNRTGWSIKSSCTPAANAPSRFKPRQTLTAAEPAPDDLAEAIAKINSPSAN
jgi:hypothetical protein